MAREAFDVGVVKLESSCWRRERTMEEDMDSGMVLYETQGRIFSSPIVRPDG